MRNITILGSTGSIGTQTLDVINAFPKKFRAYGLAANRSWELLAKEALEFNPEVVAIKDKHLYSQMKDALVGKNITILAGMEGVEELAGLPKADVVETALVGVAGLRPTLRALEAGKPIALANKETLVVGGPLVTKIAKEKNLPLLPVDSEHSAIFQCLQGQPENSLKRIILTASGGPFRTKPAASLAEMTAKEALQHPTWIMGAKITVDSASLMNKGFEVLEAMHLFDVTMEQIEVWVHPQSIVHSMVEFVDGSVLAQMGPPNMRTPIQYALGWPNRLEKSWSRLSLEDCSNLTFEKPRYNDFPCLSYAFEAGRLGGTMPCVVNAANEVAVERFLKGEIVFHGIAGTIRECMNEHILISNPTLEDLEKTDKETRNQAYQYGKFV